MQKLNYSRSPHELYHFGIKGMKWGVHRYQNKDGSLTDAGKKRVSKKYKRYSESARDDIQSSYTDRYVKAYNKAADDMNNGLTDKYNIEYDKKLGKKAKGHDYFNDKEYEKGYNDLFEKQLAKHYNELLYQDVKLNRNYQKAKKLFDDYGMENFDEFARNNEKEIEEMRSYFD